MNYKFPSFVRRGEGGRDDNHDGDPPCSMNSWLYPT